MNAVAGILIGWANPGWIGRLVVPFAWGLVWCIRQWIASGHEAYEPAAISRDLLWGMTPRTAFYFIEYSTAVATSLLFSVLSGTVKTFFA